MSCKIADGWTPVFQPALDNYQHFISNGNLSLMFQSRLDRYFYYQYILARDAKAETDLETKVNQLINYNQQYFPEGTDSIKFIFVRKDSRNFKVEVDTLYTVTHDVE
jgi:hypothetical protein